MGAKNSQNQKQILNLFKQEEIKQARAVYSSLLNEKKNVDLESFSNLFSNDIEFGIKLFKFMIKQKQQIDFIDYLCLFQTLAKEQNQQMPLNLFEGQNQLNKIQMFSLILLERYNITDLNKIMITKKEFEMIVLHLLMTYEIENLDSLIAALNGRIDPIFDESSEQFLAYNDGKISLKDATYKITKMFQAMNQIIAVYFQNKFLHKQVYIPIPTMNVKSQIMSEDLLTLLYMNNLYFQPSDNLTLLHASSMDGMSLQTIINNLLDLFKQLIHQIQLLCQQNQFILSQIDLCQKLIAYNWYDSQTLIVLKSGKGIFGVFNNQPWKNSKEPQGDDHAFIYSLLPTFQIFSTNTSQKNRNFVYMNSRSVKDYEKYQAGIGFGVSTDGTRYRLWLDELIHSQSYINFSDDCYEPGWVLPPKESQLKDKKQYISVDSIEVWGLGNNDNFQNHLERKIRNKNHSVRARKINKKLMFSLLTDFDKQILFSQTFSHLSQIREDYCCADEVEEQHRLTPQQLNNAQQLRVNEES